MLRSAVTVICTIIVTFSYLRIETFADSYGETRHNYTLLEHTPLYIICNATESDDIEIYWTKNEKKSDFYQAGSNLTFPDITRMDSGDYACHALNTTFPGDNETYSNYTVEVAHIDVQFAAEIAGFELSPGVIVENQSISVICNFMGNPGPNWEIRNNRTKQAFGRATNLAANVTLDGIFPKCGEDGFIECTGYNELSYGINVTQGRNLTVLCAPRPKETTQHTITGMIGQSVFLFVNVIGYPYPSYNWSRVDGKPMPDCTQLDYPTLSMLNITNVTLEDFGMYAVTMNNSLGTQTTHLELKAYGYPEPPYNLTYSNVTYNSVTLSWISGYDMGSKQHFIVMKQIDDGTFIQTYDTIRGDYTDHGVNTSWTTTVYGFDSDTEYTLKVLAANEYDLTTISKSEISFRTKVDPHIFRHHKHHVNVGLIVGSLAGGLSVIGFLAFVVYIVKYRRMHASYEVMNEKVKR